MADPGLMQDCLAEMRRLESEQAWAVHTAVVMPDHQHLLVTLGDTDTLSSAMRRLKGRMAPLLRKHAAAWQQSFFDHRLRPTDELLPVFLYIFLNPYRKELLPGDKSWPGYYCSSEDWTWSGQLTEEDRPQPEWLE